MGTWGTLKWANSAGIWLMEDRKMRARIGDSLCGIRAAPENFWAELNGRLDHQQEKRKLKVPPGRGVICIGIMRANMICVPVCDVVGPWCHVLDALTSGGAYVI
jgi:hypothetical protein